MNFIKAALGISTEEKSYVPDGVRVYVLGDLHGRLDLLDKVYSKIEDDIKKLDTSYALKLVFLGDYIDRGPDSKSVIDFLLKISGDDRLEKVFLKGNHEATLLNFIEDPNIIQTWKTYGGLETLHSYGVDITAVQEDKGIEDVHKSFLSLLPEDHLEFLRALKLSYYTGDYFFCHAGVRPGVELEKQSEEDLIWIRDEFLSSHADHGKVIVHGHTPVEQPEIWSNRINIDTGAYISNKLSCLILDKDNKWCI